MIGAAGAGGSAVGGGVPVFGVFLVRIFPHSRWMRGGVPPGFSVFSPGAGDAGRGAPGAHFSRGGRFPFLGGGGGGGAGRLVVPLPSFGDFLIFPSFLVFRVMDYSVQVIDYSVTRQVTHKHSLL